MGVVQDPRAYGRNAPQAAQPSWQPPQDGPIFPRQAPPAASPQQRLGSEDRFRSDVMGEIQSITGQAETGDAPQARQTYPAGLSTQLSNQPSAQQYAAPVPQIYGSRVAPAPGVPVQRAGALSVAPGLQVETIQPRNEVQWGAPAESYEAQGCDSGLQGWRNSCRRRFIGNRSRCSNRCRPRHFRREVGLRPTFSCAKIRCCPGRHLRAAGDR